MEAGLVIVMLLVLICGGAIGYHIGMKRARVKNTQGIIYAYCGDGESNPSLLLEYSVPIEDITSRTRVTFDVQVIH